MKLLIGLLFTVLGCLAVAGGWLKIPIPSPAATGLNSTYDYDALRLTDARRLVNGDLVTKPGAILNRPGWKSVGNNTVLLRNGIGYYHSQQGWKQVVGVGPGPTSVRTNRNRATNAVQTTSLQTDSSLSQIYNTANFGSGLQSNYFGYCLPYSNKAQMLKNNDQVIISDLRNGPFTYQTQRASSYFYDSAEFYAKLSNALATNGHVVALVDSAIEGKEDSTWVSSLTLEAPGQLRVGVINEYGNKNGSYSYRTSSSSMRGGRPSRVIYARNQKVFLSAFDGFVPSDTGKPYDCYLYIERSKNGGRWIRIDSVRINPLEDFIYIDSIPDTCSKAVAAYTPATNYSSIGSLVRWTPPTPSSQWPGATGNPVDSTSIYWLACSIVDPITGRESPLSTYTKSDKLVAWDGVSEIALMRFCIPVINSHYKGKRLRVYRSKANDSSGFMYAMADFPIHYAADSVTPEFIYPGNVADTTLSGGLSAVQPLAEGGTPITRPPMLSDPVTVSQVIVNKSKAWGIGDPLFPERLYYSADNEIWDWSAVNYLSMDEDDNDELVYIAKSEAIDGIYAFKHNSVYAVTGYDPQYDLTVQRLSNRHGAVNSRSVSTVAPFVYWLNPDLNVNRIAGGTIDTVSTTVWKSIKAMFVDYQEAVRHARLFKFNDRLLLTNDSTGITLAYFYVPGIWESIEGASSNRPLFAFDYDTLQTTQGFGSLADWLYLSNVVKFSVENTACRGIDSLNGTNTYYPLIYQTPFLSAEGQNVTATQATVNISGGSHVKASIWNEQDDSMVGSIVPIQGTAQRIGFSVNTAKYVSLLIRIDSMTSQVMIGDVSLSGRAVGNAAIR